MQLANIKNPKNRVILVTLDTVPSNHVGAYGYKTKTTENFDIFASENTLYKNAYSPVPYTYPAHYSIFSGLYPKNSKIINNTNRKITAPENTLIAQVFKNAGYKTAAFLGNVNLNSEEIKKGFDKFDSGTLKTAVDATERGTVDQRSAEKTNAVATKWITENKNNGFFAWIHYYDPHSPYRPNCEAPDFVGDKLPDNKTFLTGDIYDQAKVNTPVSKNDIEYLSARYDQDLYCTDKALGELFTSLKSLNIYDDTTIIVVGDHGENFDHGTIFHGDNLYESAIKIPMAVKSSKIPKGTVSSVVGLIDIYPTMLDLFSLSNFNGKKDGVNLNNKLPANRNLYFQTTKIETTGQQVSFDEKISLVAVLKSKYKLIQDFADNNIFERYNLANDEEELNKLELDPALKNELNIFFE